MSFKQSFLGGWRYALAVSLDEQSFGRQAAWRRHALKRNLNVSLNIIFDDSFLKFYQSCDFKTAKMIRVLAGKQLGDIMAQLPQHWLRGR